MISLVFDAILVCAPHLRYAPTNIEPYENDNFGDQDQTPDFFRVHWYDNPNPLYQVFMRPSQTMKIEYECRIVDPPEMPVLADGGPQ